VIDGFKLVNCKERVENKEMFACGIFECVATDGKFGHLLIK